MFLFIKKYFATSNAVTDSGNDEGPEPPQKMQMGKTEVRLSQPGCTVKSASPEGGWASILCLLM